jgi:alpha-glucosidase
VKQASAAPARSLRLQSPSGRIEAVIDVDAEGRPTYSVAFASEPLIVPSPLGLRLGRGELLSQGFRIARVETSVADRQCTLVAGKTRHARDHYRQLKVELEAGRGLELTFRAYDDGVAFRYRIPRRDGQTILIEDELTGFDFADDYGCWGLDLGKFASSHEGEFRFMRASAIAEHALLDAPLVCQTEAAAFAIAEANLDGYAGLYLRGRAQAQPGVRLKLSPRPDDPAIAVRGQPGLDVQSSWRVLMIADRPGDLIKSTLISNLNPPPRIRDTGWIKPGKYAWNWWSNGVIAGPEQSGMNDAAMRRYIDFAAETGLQYMMIDAGWYVSTPGDEGGPDADVTRSIPDIHLPALVEYGRRRNIGLLVWVHWRALHARMDRALVLYRRLGLKGIKVDFMDRNDQDMVAFYHRLLAAAARLRLLVDLHGSYPPTGLSRTYPNLLTQEGVMGAEYNKWSARVTATHNVTLPFTRMLLGPMDYTPGGFRNVRPQDFAARGTLPLVQTTRGQALAMYVVYESPLMSLADSPDAYQGQAGLDFLRAVPTTWDETRFIAGDIAEFIVIARRNCADWFVGAMTNEAERTVTVPLEFLGDGRFAATIYSDGDTPTALTITQKTVGRQDVVELRLAPSGGGAIAIRQFVD